MILPLAVVFACTHGGGETAAEDTIDAVVSEAMPTLVEVSFTPEAGATSWVEYGYDEGYGTFAPASDEGEAVLLGLKADTDVYFRVQTRVDGVDAWSEGHSIRTGPLPAGLPPVTVTAESRIVEGFALLTWYDGASGTGGVLVVDRDGDPVWWDLVDSYPPLAAHRMPDGQGITYVFGSPDHPEEAVAVVQRFDLSARTSVSTPGGHHDLVALPDGDLAVITTDVRTWEGFPVIGDRIVEVSPTGDLREIWSAWDWRAVDDGVVDNGDPAGTEWTHANGIDYDADRGMYLLSLYRLLTVVAVDRAEGAALWEVGGELSSFTFPDDVGFGSQHAPVATPGGLWLFDNHNRVGKDATSRVVGYTLDAGSGEARLDWQWTDPDERLSTPTLGDVRPLADGNVSTAWGILGRSVVLSPEGEVLWDLELEPGAVLGRGDTFASFYGNAPVVP